MVTSSDRAAVCRIGIDETAARRGHEYVTFFFDLDRRKLLFGTEGKDNETVTRFVADLKAHGGAPELIWLSPMHM